MRTARNALIALAAAAVLAGCGTGNPTLDQYTGSTATGTTPTGTSPTGTGTSPTGTSPTNTGTTPTGTGTNTTDTGRRKPPKTKIKVRAKSQKKSCRRSGRRSCRKRGRNERGLANVEVNKRRARVDFEAEPAEEGMTFKCRIDGGAFKPCESPFRSKKLKPGRHTFEVVATNKAGDSDKTSAKDRFTVRRGK